MATKTVKSVTQIAKFPKWHFRFNRWDIWKHFFKSYLYKDEQEIRLLYIEPDKEPTTDEDTNGIKTMWIQDSKNTIACRMKTFGIQHNKKAVFPLSLVSALLGSKCSSKETNESQYSYLFATSKVMPDAVAYNKVEPSKIKTYR